MGELQLTWCLPFGIVGAMEAGVSVAGGKGRGREECEAAPLT